jgi:hypothetical protein
VPQRAHGQAGLAGDVADRGLLATIAHLRTGARAQVADGLAAVYLGVSVGFGPQLMRWADQRFAHRFAGGPAPERPPRWGVAHAARERGQWYRHALAFGVGCVLLLAGWALVGDQDRAAPLLAWIPKWGLVLAVDFVWTFSYTLWPRRPKGQARRG